MGSNIGRPVLCCHQCPLCKVEHHHYVRGSQRLDEYKKLCSACKKVEDVLMGRSEGNVDAEQKS